MNIIYSNYTSDDRGPPEVLLSSQSSYLPHSYYVGMVISELCVMDTSIHELQISDMIDRLHHLISFVHEDEMVRSTSIDYFTSEENLRQVLMSIQDAGLLRLDIDTIQVTNSQLDYIRDYLLDYHNLD